MACRNWRRHGLPGKACVLVEIGFESVVGALHSGGKAVDEGLGPFAGKVCLGVAKKDRPLCRGPGVVGLELL